jgi:hypothetical protein
MKFLTMQPAVVVNDIGNIEEAVIPVIELFACLTSAKYDELLPLCLFLHPPQIHLSAHFLHLLPINTLIILYIYRGRSTKLRFM